MLFGFGDGMMHLDAGNTWHTVVTDGSGLRHHLSAPSRPELAARIGEMRGLCGPGSDGADPQPPPSSVRVSAAPVRHSGRSVEVRRLYDAVDKRDVLIADLFGQVEDLGRENRRLVERLNTRHRRGGRTLHLVGEATVTGDSNQAQAAGPQ
jgi:hypothetical protein